MIIGARAVRRRLPPLAAPRGRDGPRDDKETSLD